LRQYDVITLDLNMPDMHGLDFIHFVRSHSIFQKIPIVVISTRADESTQQKVLSSGANAYITKPFSPEQLIEMISKLLNYNSSEAGVSNE
jgi:two-component system, chemotaxis family, chemotaxis protein CheY